MIHAELDEWADDFTAFHARFAHLFGRTEPRQQAVKYVRGLLAPLERKNSWQLAEAVGECLPDATQRLLYRSDWEADAARDVLQQYIVEVLGDAEGIGVLDETSFIKKGRRSVGVQRQYSGTAGKIENCQVGTFLSYATRHGHVFLDRRLYLPQAWCDDPEQRARAHIPKEVTFQTKPEQAIAMLEHAWAQGVPMRWVTGDEVYGDASEVRDTIRRHGRLYVLAVRSHTPVWSIRPGAVELAGPARGRPPTRPRLAEGAPAALSVDVVVALWPERSWQRLTVAEGEKGPRQYDWAYQRVVESRIGRPGPDAWLLARRSISDAQDIAYYLSNAPGTTRLLTLAQVAATRYTVEQCIEEAKGETGLADYEVRHWPSWYRHITLSLMAHTWLAAVRHQATQKKGDPSLSWQP
jgi:SRSO17 transposase